MNLCETEGRLDSFTFLLLTLKANIFGKARLIGLPYIRGEASNMQCGDVSFEIVDASAYSGFLTLQGRRLILESKNLADEGYRKIFVKAFLVDYPNVMTQTGLGIQIDPC